MRIAIIGGGPGGLYFSALMKQLDPQHEIVVWERNAAEDTFGFGVVFSDETLGGIANADATIAAAMASQFEPPDRQVGSRRATTWLSLEPLARQPQRQPLWIVSCRPEVQWSQGWGR